MRDPHESIAEAASRFGPGGRALLVASKYLAIVGGLVFVALVAMSIVSIAGRKLFLLPVPGDVEVLQMCAAFASSTFFAYCHLVNGDVKVDFFTQNLARPKVAAMDAIGSLMVGLFGALIAWRTAAGALGALSVGETSTIIGWPLWIPQALMVPGFALLAASGFYMCLLHLRSALRESAAGGSA